MKNIFFTVSLYFIILNLAYSACSQYEICVKNNTTHTIKVQIYPISVVFSNRGTLNLLNGYGYPYYNPQLSYDGHVFNYINGMSILNSSNDNGEMYVDKITSYYIPPGGNEGLDDDRWVNPVSNLSAQGVFGFGTYKIEIIHCDYVNGETAFERDSLLADFDYYCRAPYFLGYECPEIPEKESPGDLSIEVNDLHSFTYQFNRCSGTQNNVVTVNAQSYLNGHLYYSARSWHPNLPECYTNDRAKCMGPWSYEFFNHPTEMYGSAYIYTNFPLDVRVDCNYNVPGIWVFQDQNHIFPIKDFFWSLDENRKEVRQGTLKLNLELNDGYISTHQNNLQVINRWTVPLIIDSGARLRLINNANPMVYELFKNDNTIDKDFYMRVNNYGILDLNTNSKIIANDRTHIIFEEGSNVIASAHSFPHIIIKNDATICNYGAHIEGKLWISYQEYPHPWCNDIVSDNITFNDSMRVQLSDSAIFEIPDNKTLLIDGPETNLILDSNSIIKFGNNAKLVVKNGANISAVKSKFTSLTSGAAWDGIYLEDVSNDVIKNCIIENAMSGINVKDKLNDYAVDTVLASVEISDCQFINSTTTQLVSGIYLANSNTTLIRNNTFSSTSISNGFASALSIEYCPSGNINIIDNALNYSLIGISVFNHHRILPGIILRVS